MITKMFDFTKRYTFLPLRIIITRKYRVYTKEWCSFKR